MIAFYCWTDTLLMNSLRVKTGTMAAEQADLIVLMLPRVSERLVDRLEQTGCFRRVFRVQPPEDRLFGRFYKLFKLFRYRYYKQAIRNQLSGLSSRYDRLFSGGLWSYTIVLHDLMLENQPSLPIAFVEEGIANYGGMLSAMWCDPKGRKRDWLFRTLFYKNAYERAAQSADALYLLCLPACLEPGRLRLHKYPSSTAAFDALVKEFVQNEDALPYRSRQVVVFLQPEAEDDQRKTVQFIRALADAYGPDQMIVRPHPDDLHAMDRASLDPDIWIDRSRTPFEFTMTQVDWSDKVLVSRASSCMFYPLYAFQQQPQVYFMFNLYVSGDEFLIQKLSKKLQCLYSDPSRVRFPNNLADFQQMLSLQKNHETEVPQP